MRRILREKGNRKERKGIGEGRRKRTGKRKRCSIKKEKMHKYGRGRQRRSEEHKENRKNQR